MKWRALMFAATWFAQASLPMVMFALLVAGYADHSTSPLGPVLAGVVFSTPDFLLLGVCLICTIALFSIALSIESAKASAIVVTAVLIIFGVMAVGVFLSGVPPRPMTAIVLSMAVVAIWQGAAFLFVTWAFRRLKLDPGFAPNPHSPHSQDGAKESR